MTRFDALKRDLVSLGRVLGRGNIRSYASMQSQFYEAEAPRMGLQNHSEHDANPYLWLLGYGPAKANSVSWFGGKALDFACGAGRNMRNIFSLGVFGEVHGADISRGNLDEASRNLARECPTGNFRFHKTDGMGLQVEEDCRYDFVFSTIALQHIPVWQLRQRIFGDIRSVMSPGGVFSFQMGFGGSKTGAKNAHGSVPYKSNFYEAPSTNSSHDTRVENPKDLVRDLEDAGFSKVMWFITPSWWDGHPQWIWVHAS